MVNGSEFDTPFFFSMDEPDTSMGSGNTYHGDRAGRIIKKWLAENGKRKVSEATYLGLGSGQAFQEIAFARHLGVAPNRVTLVDRRIPGYTRDRVSAVFPGAEFTESGIFTYLANPPKSNFSFVSAFGIEYLFTRKGAAETFVDAMPDMVGQNGIVFISFYCGPNVDSRWRKAGFEVVRGHTGSWSQLMYTKR